jgi:hypothetical protein
MSWPSYKMARDPALGSRPIRCSGLLPSMAGIALDRLNVGWRGEVVAR